MNIYNKLLCSRKSIYKKRIDENVYRYTYYEDIFKNEPIIMNNRKEFTLPYKNLMIFDEPQDIEICDFIAKSFLISLNGIGRTNCILGKKQYDVLHSKIHKDFGSNKSYNFVKWHLEIENFIIILRGSFSESKIICYDIENNDKTIKIEKLEEILKKRK